MKLYLLSQTVVRGYDTYDSCVVVAEDAIAAVSMHPHDGSPLTDYAKYDFADWPTDTINITCKYLGEAHHSFTEPAVICSSFNAG
jgi:hypothetical protein